MLGTGVLYLLFDEHILSSSNNKGSKDLNLSGWSRAILGVQIGLIVLAMIVTRSSIASLQAKKGLPAGNQALGWIVLGKVSNRVLGQEILTDD